MTQNHMRFEKVLLYPFSIDRPYFEGYAWAVELAFRMKAKLQLFTTSAKAPNKDSVYHSLLEAHGYYLEHYRHTGAQWKEVVGVPFIVEGELKEELLQHLKKNPVDIVILDSHTSTSQITGLKEIVKESGGVIVLSDGQLPSENKSAEPMADHFYDILRKAKLYKLPENFFATLGKDRSVFNYLRKFFQAKALK